MTLGVDELRTDGGTQPRAAVHRETVGEYAADMTEGAKFPAVVVFFDGNEYWLSDGFHRLAAAKQIGLTEIAVEIHQGQQRDAVLYSVGVNSAHGMRRTNEDKRRAVTTLLRDDEWGKWSDREIARRCSVGHHLVASVRKDLTGGKPSEKPKERTYTTKHGTTATMDTSKVGSSRPKPKAAPKPSDFWEPNTEEPQPAPPPYDEATTPTRQIVEWIDIKLERITSLSLKHEIINNVLKYVRELSVRFNREAE